MNTQPEALRLADELEAMFGKTDIDERVCKELRRLHEENEALRQALAQPEQEPVLAGSLSVRYFRGDKAMTDTDFEYLGDLSEGDYTLYTAPPKREPLMTKYVIDLWDEYGVDPIKFAREIEAAHGIKENT